MSESNLKGKKFEKQVEGLLLQLQSLHPDQVSVKQQLRFELHDGQTVIPDFELKFNLLFEKAAYLIECQNRKRSSPYIAQKIKYIKALSKRNKFIFVYSKSIPKSTANALDADGVVSMSLVEFAAFIAKLELQIRSQKITIKDDALVLDPAIINEISRNLPEYDENEAREISSLINKTDLKYS